MITVIDYGLGNIGSIMNALEKLGVKAKLASSPKKIVSAKTLIFPGDGAAPATIENLKKMRLIDPIRNFLETNRPFLGICLGMQILLDFSEEGNTKCLGIIKGEVKKFQEERKVPQIGWNQVKMQQCKNATMQKLFSGIKDNSFFYFINSYYCDPRDKNIVVAKTDYGEEFCSVFRKENIIGVQFHPEKSGSIGMKLLRNWIYSYAY